MPIGEVASRLKEDIKERGRLEDCVLEVEALSTGIKYN